MDAIEYQMVGDGHSFAENVQAFLPLICIPGQGGIDVPAQEVIGTPIAAGDEGMDAIEHQMVGDSHSFVENV